MRKSPISARERARQSTAGRLAEGHARLKKNEDDVVAFFDAGKTTEKVTADVEKKIHAIRDDAATKIAAAEREQAVALRSMKERGEIVAAIAEATELSSTEVRRFLTLAADRTTPAASAQRDSPATGAGDSE